MHPREEAQPLLQKTAEEQKASEAFKYDFVDKDLIAYMKDIMLTYTTEDAQTNIDNKLFLVERIQAKLRDHGITIDD